VIGLAFRVVLWSIVAMTTLTVLALWALLWVTVFVVSLVWTAFDSSRGRKRLERPAMPRRRNDDRELDAFGHPIPQSRWSSRR
jgi:hypothetical protein